MQTSADVPSVSGSFDSAEDDTEYRVGQQCEVYSKSNNAWCEASVIRTDEEGGTLQVEYKTKAGSIMQKVLEADSQDLRKPKRAAAAGSGWKPPPTLQGDLSPWRASKSDRANVELQAAIPQISRTQFRVLGGRASAGDFDAWTRTVGTSVGGAHGEPELIGVNLMSIAELAPSFSKKRLISRAIEQWLAICAPPGGGTRSC